MDDKSLKDKLYDFTAKNFQWIVLAILIFSFILRWKYFNINTAIWYDEGSYLAQARLWGLNLPLVDTYYFRRTFFLPLLWAGLLKLGFTETAFRWTELLFSIGAVYFVYLLGRLWFNKYVGAIAAFILGSSWLHLFFTSRLLTNIPALFLILGALYFFLRGYPSKPKFLYLSAVFYGLAAFTRFSFLIALIPLVVYLFTKDKFKFLKNKHLWVMGIIFLLVLSPFIFKFFTYSGEGAGVGNFFTHYFADRPFLIDDYILDIGYIFSGTFLILLIIGLLYFLDLFLGFDMVFKDEKIRRKLFMLIWVITPIIVFGLITAMVEERYLMLALPMFALLIGYACTRIFEFAKSRLRSEWLGVIVILVLLVLGAFSQITFADSLIVNKKDSYIHIKYAGEWINQNSLPTDWIISSGEPQLKYYSDRNVQGYPRYEEDFWRLVDEKHPKFMMLTPWERSADYAYSLPDNYPDKIKPIQAWFIDEAQQQAGAIIYEFVY